MKLDEVSPLLDVHPPHEPVHGWRDFLLHLFTITVGLLIALGLEGLVERQHHRHLVHEAETSLHNEIAGNAKDLPGVAAELHKEQQQIKDDLNVIEYVRRHHKAPEHSSLTVNFNISELDNVGWKTAQISGALAYMPYSKSQQYADIFSSQDELTVAEQQAARDVILSLGPIMNFDSKAADPTGGRAELMEDRLEVLQGQLLLVDSVLRSLDKSYRKFLANDHA